MYCGARGLSPVPSDEALLVASEWIDGVYGARFPGVRLAGRAQDRAWPRKGATDREGQPIIGIPDEVVYATIEAAIREDASPGSLAPDVVPAMMLKAARVEGAVSVTYAVPEGGDPMGMVPVLTRIEGILWPILTGSGNTGIGVQLIA